MNKNQERGPQVLEIDDLSVEHDVEEQNFDPKNQKYKVKYISRICILYRLDYFTFDFLHATSYRPYWHMHL